MAGAYTTSTTVGYYMGTSFDGDSTPTENQITDVFVPAVEGYIDEYTDTSFKSSASVVEFHDVTGERKVYLNRPNIITVWRVHEDVSGIGNSPSWTRRFQGRGNDYIVYDDESGDHGAVHPPSVTHARHSAFVTSCTSM